LFDIFFRASPGPLGRRQSSTVLAPTGHRRQSDLSDTGLVVLCFNSLEASVVYCEYAYDLLSRLINVTKNGTIVSEYGYDPTGLRVVKGTLV
jgi:hypothetical protein